MVGSGKSESCASSSCSTKGVLGFWEEEDVEKKEEGLKLKSKEGGARCEGKEALER